VIAVVPAQGIRLQPEVVETALERLELAVSIAIVIELDLAEVVKTAIDREIASPIIGVAGERHGNAGLHGSDAVGSGAYWRFKCCFLERCGIGRMPRQDRHQAEDQWQFTIMGVSKIEAHGVRI